MSSSNKVPRIGSWTTEEVRESESNPWKDIKVFVESFYCTYWRIILKKQMYINYDDISVLLANRSDEHLPRLFERVRSRVESFVQPTSHCWSRGYLKPCKQTKLSCKKLYIKKTWKIKLSQERLFQKLKRAKHSYLAFKQLCFYLLGCDMERR